MNILGVGIFPWVMMIEDDACSNVSIFQDLTTHITFVKSYFKQHVEEKRRRVNGVITLIGK